MPGLLSFNLLLCIFYLEKLAQMRINNCNKIKTRINNCKYLNEVYLMFMEERQKDTLKSRLAQSAEI